MLAVDFDHLDHLDADDHVELDDIHDHDHDEHADDDCDHDEHADEHCNLHDELGYYSYEFERGRGTR